MKLVARGRTISFPRRPLVMGIINVCADSFSGDGVVDVDAAVARARQMVEDGADIIDVGGESAGTKRAAMPEEEEIANLLGFVERFQEVFGTAQPADGDQLFPPLLSINTWRPQVAREVLRGGGDLLNDIGALRTNENAITCAETGAALLIMHTVGEPKIPHTHVQYEDIWSVLDRFFEEKIAVAKQAGVDEEAIILDPGIDFAKQKDDNLHIYRELERLHRFERPILLPVSRKTVIGDVLNLSPAQRDAGTVACIVSGMQHGAHIFRVHNVRAAVETVKMIAAVDSAG